jgi:tripartite-type tricarboxylate transporter receptor subunit TctC
MATQPNLMVVHPSVPAKTLPELIGWLKANPKTPYATSGIGSSQHICGEMLAQEAGLEIVPVAYRASNQQMQDLISGQIKVACDNFSTAWEQVKARQRAIAVGCRSATVLTRCSDICRNAERFRLHSAGSSEARQGNRRRLMPS